MVSWEKIRLLRTVNLYLSYFAFGLVSAIPGPTLLDLGKNVGADTQEMSYVLAARWAGLLIGSLVAGYMFNKHNRQLLLIGCFTLIAFSNLIIPLTSSYIVLMAAMVLIGFAMGAMDTGGTVWCLDLWSINPAPYMQALHFFYGSGAFVGPLVGEPFLSTETIQADDEFSSDNVTFSYSGNETAEMSDGNVVIPYSIFSGFFFLVILSSIVAFCLDGSELKSNTEKVRSTTQMSGTMLPRTLITFAMLFLMSYVGLEATYPQFLTTYLVKSKLNLSKSTGSFMTSVYWGLFCVFRGLAILFATKVSPFAMLVTNIAIMNACGVVLSVWGESSATIMWVFTGILGMGMASTWANVFAWLEIYVGISNNIASLFVVSCSAGALVMAMIIGSSMEIIVNIVLYTVSICAFGCLLTFLGMYKIVRLIISRGKNASSARNRPDNLKVSFKEVKFEKESYPA